MRLDVAELVRFYASPLGQAAVAMINRRLAALWPEARGLDMLGLGYAAPFLEPYRASARRTVAAMPAAQGCTRWPAEGGVCAALVEETTLPFREALFDRAIVAHVLEETEALRPVLRELWRATAPEARIVVVAASRSGLWSRAETSPFAHGRSFTRGQLARVLTETMFAPTAWSRALFMPPLPWGPVARAAEGWERLGERLWPKLGGVILVEARKHVVAAPSGGRRQPVFSPARAPAPARRVGPPAEG